MELSAAIQQRSSVRAFLDTPVPDDTIQALLELAARLARLAENYKLFGAPAVVFCFVERAMGPPQWSDLGMFLQTFMLGAVDAGLDTCAQEAWASYGDSIAEFVGAPRAEMLFCGVALGHRDPDAAVNQLRSERMPVDQWATWV